MGDPIDRFDAEFDGEIDVPLEGGKTLSKDIVEQLVMLRKVSDPTTLETSRGTRPAVFVEVLVLTPDGEVIEAGELPIFWTVVIRQLVESRRRWLAGRITKRGNAYRVVPPEAEDMPRLRATLELYNRAHR